MNRRTFLFGRAGQTAEFLSDETGASAVEYGLLGGLIAVGLVGTLTRVGKKTKKNTKCVKRALKGKDQNKFCKKRGA